MTQHLVLLLVCLMSFPTFAATQARVIKTKGYQAIVQFPNGEKPRVGQVVEIAGENDSDPVMAGDKIGTGERAHVLAVSAELSIMSTNSDDETSMQTHILTTGRYGWNKETWEAGPLGTFDLTTGGSYTSRTISIGGYGDWNLIPNRPGTVWVYGAGAMASFGTQATSVSGGSETTSTAISIFGGGQMKWFGLSENVAVRVDAGLGYDKKQVLSQDATSIGFKGLLGLSFYY